jgi:ankyrin repeat protein
MEEGNYKEWIERYPQNTLSIFSALLYFNGNYLKEEDIFYFINNGVYLNTPSKAYASNFDSTTILVFACEHRYLNLVRHLLKLGANVNQRDPNDISPLESGLMGHGLDCISNFEETESLVKILMEYNVDKEIKKTVFEDYCQDYLKKSEYLSNIFDSCNFIE